MTWLSSEFLPFDKPLLFSWHCDPIWMKWNGLTLFYVILVLYSHTYGYDGQSPCNHGAWFSAMALDPLHFWPTSSEFPDIASLCSASQCPRSSTDLQWHTDGTRSLSSNAQVALANHLPMPSVGYNNPMCQIRSRSAHNWPWIRNKETLRQFWFYIYKLLSYCAFSATVSSLCRI